MAKLVVISEPLAGFTFELGESWTTIGRSDCNMFQLVENSVSSRHCEVKARGDELLVRDLNSTNGTFVSGMKVTEGVVKFGQIFRVGYMDLRFESTVASVPKISLIGAGTVAPRAVMPLPPKPVVADDAAPKYHVLFVDDSMAFLESFPKLCMELSGGQWEVHTASTADAALVILQEQTINLAILDVGMPMLDGIQLLGIIHRRYPHLKVAILTALASETNRATCLSSGAELFLEKPTSNADIRIAFRMLDDVLQWSQRKGFSGALQHINLPDVIQLECLNRNSLILEVRNAQAHGQIFIESGEITHAVMGATTGEPAFRKVLLLSGGEFQVKPFKAPVQRTIEGRWEFLLMDAARAADEQSGAKAAESETALQKAPPPPETRGHALPDEIVVVATYDGGWHEAEDAKK